MLPAWGGEEDTPLRHYLIAQGFGGNRYLAIRQGQWKYLAHKGSGGNNYEKSRWLQEYALPDTEPDAPGQLFDLATDPGETTNLAVKRADIAKQMSDLLEKSLETGRSAPNR